METSLLIQYIIIAVLVLAACYSIFKIFKKNFSPKKFKDNDNGCSSKCCS